MNLSDDALDVVRAVEMLWEKTLSSGRPSRIAVLLALAGFDSCPNEISELRLTAEGRNLLIDRLAEKRVPRRTFLSKANHLLACVARSLGTDQTAPLTPGNFGVVICRLRRLLWKLVTQPYRNGSPHHGTNSNVTNGAQRALNLPGRRPPKFYRPRAAGAFEDTEAVLTEREDQ